MALKALIADANVEGQIAILLQILISPTWSEFWQHLQLGVESFESLEFSPDIPDDTLWRTCQKHGLILITGNRNSDGDDSLETTIRRENTATSLPVFTLADPNRINHDREYALRTAERLLEYLLDIDKLLGTGRLYVP